MSDIPPCFVAAGDPRRSACVPTQRGKGGVCAKCLSVDGSANSHSRQHDTVRSEAATRSFITHHGSAERPKGDSPRLLADSDCDTVKSMRGLAGRPERRPQHRRTLRDANESTLACLAPSAAICPGQAGGRQLLPTRPLATCQSDPQLTDWRWRSRHKVGD